MESFVKKFKIINQLNKWYKNSKMMWTISNNFISIMLSIVLIEQLVTVLRWNHCQASNIIFQFKKVK